MSLECTCRALYDSLVMSVTLTYKEIVGDVELLQKQDDYLILHTHANKNKVNTLPKRL